MPEKSFSCCLTNQPNRPRWMKEKSVKVPALKDLLGRPLDVGTVELAEAAMSNHARFGANWTSFWGKATGFGADWVSIPGAAFRSLKRHGSSPECVLDLLCFLDESSDEKMQQMDLDDVTAEQVTAARSALREVIGDAELAVKKGETRWHWDQGAPWLWYLSASWPCLGSEALARLQAVEARASILMTRLEEEAEKENHTTCLQEVA